MQFAGGSELVPDAGRIEGQTGVLPASRDTSPQKCLLRSKILHVQGDMVEIENLHAFYVASCSSFQLTNTQLGVP